jgi:hypothetical protein
MSETDVIYGNLIKMVLGNNTNRDKKGIRRMQRRDSVLTNAEKQRRFRERMKADGYKRIIIWVDDDDLFKYTGMKIHRSNLDICKTDENVKILLTSFLKLLCEQTMNKKFPLEVFQDIAESFKPFGAFQ